jgi:hypothetical protein
MTDSTPTRTKREPKISETLDAVGDAVEKAASQVAEKMGQVAGEVKGTMTQVAGEVKGKVEKVAEEAAKAIPTPLENLFEAQKRALSEALKALEGLIPQATRDHGKAAVEQAIDGYRQFVNSTVDEIVKLVERVKINKGEKPEDDKAE